MKKSTTLEVIASLLIFFFAYTALSSYYNMASLRNLLAFYTAHTTQVAWLMVATEVALALLLLFRKTRLVGLVASLCLLLYAGSFWFEYRSYPHDFGGVFNELSYKQQLTLLSILLLLSVTGIVLHLLKAKPNTNAKAVTVSY
jgi:hypothetical protein